MQLFIRGLAGETYAFEAQPDADVCSVQTTLAALTGIQDQQLVFGGKTLNKEETLAGLGLLDEATIFVTGGLDGGAKKRKKKTYTKPKKIKHKRKKVKLAVLKFYKVDSNDKVSRLRRECPHEMCGPGVFMAMHFNRYYCGKCHLTYLIKKGE
eukprot:TRINITY_DN627_c0_g2_i1.p2 TRINITY_DN627_c0_g2~~TRINITY_DN627_c0_g2_i1.p2  ORF type:complete len:153 (-),score=51.65 TRINITY_DN627_c0_g2_i1:84-542(-)